MDSQSLSAIVEVERSITRGELDVDGAMHLIVDSARNVANATGVAIGLLKGDQLVYRAGSGSAATYIGRHVRASLTVSADTKASREILPVGSGCRSGALCVPLLTVHSVDERLRLPVATLVRPARPPRPT